jgi:hypothetical protein
LFCHRSSSIETQAKVISTVLASIDRYFNFKGNKN